MDHVERVKDKTAVLDKAFSTPLSALGHVLGDGSPQVKRGGTHMLMTAAGGRALDAGGHHEGAGHTGQGACET